MIETITAVYDTYSKAQNAADDLLSTGIDSEKVYLDDRSPQVKVMTPKAIQGEIKEILQRHQPTEVSEKPLE